MRALLVSLAFLFAPCIAAGEEYPVTQDQTASTPVSPVPRIGDHGRYRGTACWSYSIMHAIGRTYARRGLDAATSHLAREIGRNCTAGIPYDVRIVRYAAILSYHDAPLTLVVAQTTTPEHRLIYFLIEGEPQHTL